MIGRVKAYEAIVKGNNIPEPGVPESFKVLIKELQSIGLDIKVLSADSNEIDIRDEEEEEIKAHRAKAEQAAPPAEPVPEPEPEPEPEPDPDSFDDDFDSEPSEDEIELLNKSYSRNNDALSFDDDNSFDNLFPIDDDYKDYDE